MNKVLLNKEIFRYANRIEKQIKLETLLKYNFNSFKKNSNFKIGFKDDLLTRLSKRTVELENLPYGLSAMPSIKNLSGWYIKSFQELYNYNNFANDDELINILTKIYARHADTSEKITEGLKQLNDSISKRYDEDVFQFLKVHGHLPFGDFEKLNNALDNFYTNRFSVRLLIDQYINYENNKENYVGVINKKTSPLKILNDAVEDAIQISEHNYYESPEIKINAITDPTLCYIPSHLYYVFFELIKNSIRASLESNKDPIDIVVSGEDDIMIKISDKGNGIPYPDIEKIWYYSYTTVNNNFYNAKLDPNDIPMAGFGLGLPISRSILKFLGGDIKLMSMENYGTDVYISLPKEK